MSPAKLADGIDEMVEKAYAEGHSVPEIARELELQLGDDAPSERTVRRRVDKLKPAEDDQAWSLRGTEDGEGARLILEVIYAISERTEGRRQNVSRGEAGWIVKLRRAFPSMPPWTAYRLSRLYLARSGSEPTGDLDAFVAGAPWVEEKLPHYFAMVVAGWVAEPSWAAMSVLPAFEEGYLGASREARRRRVEHFLTGLEVPERDVASATQLVINRDHETWMEDIERLSDVRESPREAMEQIIRRVAKALQRPEDWNDEIDRILDVDTQSVEGLMSDSGLDRAAAEEAFRRRRIEEREQARRTLIDAALPRFIRPLVGFNEELSFADGRG